MHHISKDTTQAANAIGSAAAIEAALEAGVPQALLDGPATATDLAEKLGLHPRALGRVLGVLAASGLLERDGERWCASQPLRDLDTLVPRGVAGMTGMYLHTRTFLRTGAPLFAMDGSAASRGASYELTVAALARMFAAAARDLAAKLPARRRILDVGAGAGVWSLAMAARDPQTHVTALDLPGVVDRFRERAAEGGLGDRVATIVGDAFEVAAPRAAFDRVIVANVLHLEPPDRAAALLRRLAGSLAPGGEMVIVDALGSGESVAEALYALHLALRTTRGQVHAAAEVRRWVADAGLQPGELIALEGGPAQLGALLAHAR